MAMPEVDIIIVATNQLEYTRQCVESIFANTRTPFRIIFIDNASTDGTSEALADLAKKCPSNGAIEVLRNAENLGWTKGVNQGIRYSSARHVILSNNDVEVFPGAIEEMIAIADADPRAGIVNPSSNEFDIEKKNYAETVALKGRKIELMHAAGFFMLVKREVIDRVGLFDEVFSPGYFEEMDYSERARKAGFSVCVAEGAYVFHYGSRSFRPADKQRLWERNEKVFYERWGTDARCGFVANARILKDADFRKRITQALLDIIRGRKSYVYLFLPFGAKKYFKGIHRYLRPVEVPAGFRWLSLYMKAVRVPARKKIDAIYFADPSRLEFCGKLDFFKGVDLKMLPGFKDHE